MPQDSRDTRYSHTTTMNSADTDSLFHFPRMDSHHSLMQYAGAGPGGGHASSQGLVRHRNNLSTLSFSSRISLPNRVTTLEVFDLVYGDAPGAAPVETVERLYEANAGACHGARLLPGYRYDNPLITASSRQIIGDINSLSRQLRELDVPRPLAMFKTLFRPHSSGETREPWFQALRIWSDIEDICDSESFDGQHLSIVEHTLNILLLPGLHSDEQETEQLYPDADSFSVASIPVARPHPQPSLSLPGLRGLSLPSPLHLKLRVLTRLSFNEQGRITRHRDVWDVRDVLGLVPGMQVAQWIGTRATAHGLSWAVHLAARMFGRKSGSEADDNDVERGQPGIRPKIPASGFESTVVSASSSRGDVRAGTEHGFNALGLHLEEAV
ncbi:hypothetical protein DFH11DRAFT_1502531 [Phellopilus nigrolimitatus]|nr:hypothetical protein DFH11DRAFT_1502531 [Phellopilus nigrolimitatus]